MKVLYVDAPAKAQVSCCKWLTNSTKRVKKVLYVIHIIGQFPAPNENPHLGPIFVVCGAVAPPPRYFFQSPIPNNTKKHWHICYCKRNWSYASKYKMILCIGRLLLHVWLFLSPYHIFCGIFHRQMPHSHEFRSFRAVM